MPFQFALAVAAAAGINVPTVDVGLARHVASTVDDGQAGAADVELWIAPDGIVVDCKVLRSVGAEITVNQMCPAIVNYQIGSGTAADGTSVFSAISYFVVIAPDNWGRPRRERLVSDLIRQRADSPEAIYVDTTDLRWSGGWSISVQIGVDGRIEDCVRSNDNVDETSATHACLALSTQTFPVRLQSDGEPARYVTRVFARPPQV